MILPCTEIQWEEYDLVVMYEFILSVKTFNLDYLEYAAYVVYAGWDRHRHLILTLFCFMQIWIFNHPHPFTTKEILWRNRFWGKFTSTSILVPSFGLTYLSSLNSYVEHLKVKLEGKKRSHCFSLLLLYWSCFLSVYCHSAFCDLICICIINIGPV